MYIVSCNITKRILELSIEDHCCFVYQLTEFKQDLDSIGVKYSISAKDGLMYSFKYLGWYD